MKCTSKQDEIISSSQNFLKGKNVNKAGKIPTLPKRRDCQQSVSRLICGLVHISEERTPTERQPDDAQRNALDESQRSAMETAAKAVRPMAKRLCPICQMAG